MSSLSASRSAKLGWLMAVCALRRDSGPSLNRRIASRRTQFAVTSEHPSATAAGLAILEAGGNVVDAAVTTSLALGVAAPYGSGLGGKLVMLYRDGGTGNVTCVEALPAAPRKLDPRFRATAAAATTTRIRARFACPVCRQDFGRRIRVGGRCPGTKS